MSASRALSGRQAARDRLSEAAFTDVLTGAGLLADLAALLADADAAASRGALFDDEGALGRLIGRPTTPMESVVTAALRS
jgi:NAD(P)H dehydrogenase (quinone)